MFFQAPRSNSNKTLKYLLNSPQQDGNNLFRQIVLKI